MANGKELRMNPHTNLLEKSEFDYVLQDVPEPNLYRIMFDYEHIPKIAFNMRVVPMAMPEQISSRPDKLRGKVRPLPMDLGAFS